MFGKHSGRGEGAGKKNYHTLANSVWPGSSGSSQPGIHSARPNSVARVKSQTNFPHLYTARYKQHPTPKSMVGLSAKKGRKDVDMVASLRGSEWARLSHIHLGTESDYNNS